MRHVVYAALVLGPVAALAALGGVFTAPTPSAASVPPAAATARACDSHCRRDWMDANLALNQVQLVGTAASYKQKPSGGVLTIIRMGGRANAEALDFGEPALAAQLDNGVRALSFDIARLVNEDPALGERIHPDGPEIWAQVVYARDHEWAATADDVLRRRTTLTIRGLDTEQVRDRVAKVLAD